jgi:hypothetical protein
MKVYRNQEYLKWIRNQICLFCNCGSPDAHHVRRQYWGAGTGYKPHDYVTIPLCRYNKCHDPKIEKRFDCKKEIIRLLTKYIIEKYGKKDLINILMEAIEKEGRPKK